MAKAGAAVLPHMFAQSAVHIGLITLALRRTALEPGNHIRIDAKRELFFDWAIELQMAEVAVPRQLFADILRLIARLRAPPAPA